MEVASKPRHTKLVQRVKHSRVISSDPTNRTRQAEITSILHSTGAQAKLTIGQPNDKYEKEADCVADHVVAGQIAPHISPVSIGDFPSKSHDQAQLQAQDDSEEKIQEKELQDESEEPLQTKLIQCMADEEANKDELAQTKWIQRLSDSEEDGGGIQAKGGSPSAEAASNAIRQSSDGRPMRTDVRSILESSMGADLSDVRVHEGVAAQTATKSIHARAFTHKQDIWLGEGESQSDLHLMAHESTHVLQQGSVARRKPVGISQVEPHVQRWWNPIEALSDAVSSVSDAVSSAVEWVGDSIGKAIDYIKDKAKDVVASLPGYSLFTVAFGKDPITGQAVARNGRNFIEAGLDIIPNGGALKQKLEENGKLEEAAGWLDGELNTLDISPTEIAGQLSRFWSSLSIGDVTNLGGVMDRLLAIVRGPIERIIRFALTLAGIFLKFIKDALVSKMVDYARTTRGYPLLTVILGKDPFSEEPVERSTENIIHGFMGLTEGGEEQFQEMKKTGAIDRMSTRIERALAALNFTWEFIRGLFVTAWESFGLPDIAHPFDAFQRLIALFSEPIGRLFNFVVAVIRMVIEVILQLMHFPVALISNIISKSIQAIGNIKRDPIGFLKNLMRAVKAGFSKFFKNIAQHLIDGVTGWLFGQLDDAGITPPVDLSFKSILGLVMQILGITIEKIFKKLADKIGQDKVDKIKRMGGELTGIWAFVSDVMTRGPVAIWEYIQEKLSGLWETVLESVRNWVVTKIVQQATAKLLSFLDPTGILAVVNGFIAFFKAVQSFIQYLKEMLEIVNSFVEGVAEIASGSVETAANYLENALGRAMVVAIGFLANQAGLGSLGSKIREMIGKVQDVVDKGLTWLVDKAVNAGTAFLNVLTSGVDKVKRGISNFKEWWKISKKITTQDGKEHKVEFTGSGASSKLIIRSTPAAYSQYLEDIKKTNDLTDEQINPAKKIVEEIKVEKNRGKNIPDDQKEAHGQNILALVDVLANLTSSLPLKSANGINTEPVYGPLRKGFGTVSRVAYLESPHEKDGSRPSVENTEEYNDINIRRKGGGSYYVKGHLLNENLRGKGTTWSNLTPLTQQANSDHKTKFEKDAKVTVNGKEKGYSKVKIGYMKAFMVKAEYGYNVAKYEGLIAQLLGADDEISGLDPKANRQDVAKILRAEQYVPKRLVCSVQLYNNGGVNSIQNLSIENEISYGQLSEYQLIASPKSQYTLTDHFELISDPDSTGITDEQKMAAMKKLLGLNGIDEAIALNIYNIFSTKGRIYNYQRDIGISKQELEEKNPSLRITGGRK